MQIQASPEVHDVVVIGSGATGGMNLTCQGVNGLMLDAGEILPPDLLDPREAMGVARTDR